MSLQEEYGPVAQQRCWSPRLITREQLSLEKEGGQIATRYPTLTRLSNVFSATSRRLSNRLFQHCSTRTKPVLFLFSNQPGISLQSILEMIPAI